MGYTQKLLSSLWYSCVLCLEDSDFGLGILVCVVWALPNGYMLQKPGLSNSFQYQILMQSAIKYSGTGIAIPSKFERPLSSSFSDLYCAPSPLKKIFSFSKSKQVLCLLMQALPVLVLIWYTSGPVSGHHLLTQTSLTSFFFEFKN